MNYFYLTKNILPVKSEIKNTLEKCSFMKKIDNSNELVFFCPSTVSLLHLADGADRLQRLPDRLPSLYSSAIPKISTKRG